MGRRARIRRVRPHERQRQPQPLRPDAPHPRHDPDRDRRQRLARRPVVVAGRTPLQAGAARTRSRPPRPADTPRAHAPASGPPAPRAAATASAARRSSSPPAPAPPTPDAPPAPTTPSRSARGSPLPASPATARSPASTADAAAPDSSRSASPPPPRTAPPIARYTVSCIEPSVRFVESQHPDGTDRVGSFAFSPHGRTQLAPALLPETKVSPRLPSAVATRPTRLIPLWRSHTRLSPWT